MSKILLAAVFSALIGLASSPASAQQVVVPCAAFANSPFVCVNNLSNYPVSYVECDGWQAPNVGSLPYIPAHGIGAVKFNKSYCSSIVVHTMDGKAHAGLFFDAKRSTVLTILGW